MEVASFRSGAIFFLTLGSGTGARWRFRTRMLLRACEAPGRAA
jgi:hypothetical protein